MTWWANWNETVRNYVVARESEKGTARWCRQWEETGSAENQGRLAEASRRRRGEAKWRPNWSETVCSYSTTSRQRRDIARESVKGASSTTMMCQTGTYFCLYISARPSTLL